MRKKFFHQFIHHHKVVGSVTPSSRFLTEAMLSPIVWQRAQNIVELGPGTGVMTHQIISRLSTNARLCAYEINTEFIEELRKIEDPRFVLRETSAWDIAIKEPAHSVDAIVSGLPLTHFSHAQVRDLMRAIKQVLKPNGVYVQFQYAPLRLSVVREAFPDTTVLIEVRNIPPACVYVVRNTSVDAGKTATVLPQTAPSV